MNPDDRLPLAHWRGVLREMWRALGRRGWSVSALVCVFLAAAAAGVLPPLALGRVVDVVSQGGDAGAIWLAAIVIAGSVVAGAVFTAVGVIGISRLLETMLAEMRESMVSAALRLPQSRVERAGTGDLISRASDDVSGVAEAIPSVVPALTGSLFTIAVTCAGMAVIDFRYALALLVIVPIHFYAVRRYLRDVPQLYAEERSAMARRAEHLLDSLRGIETVRAFALSRPHLSRIGSVSWAVVRWTMQARAGQNAFFARLNAAEFAGMTALLVMGFFVVNGGSGSIGGLTAVMLLFLRLFDPINQLLFVIDEMQSAFASLSRIVGVVDAGRDRQRAPRQAASSDGGVRLRRVLHAYPDGPPVLMDVNLDVAQRETVAVVGASGAGKSTLAAIIAGVHEASAGSVVVPDDVMLVTQEVHVFAGTLRDNLTLARAGADDAAVRRALAGVGAAALIERLPDGLDTVLDSSRLTMAEAQQLALARVLLADPDAVVLDEATAEAGSSEADRLEAAASAVTAERTAVVVAHRLSQAVIADRVVFMERGRIEEEGTHAELLASGERYARLWAAWRRYRD